MIFVVREDFVQGCAFGWSQGQLPPCRGGPQFGLRELSCLWWDQRCLKNQKLKDRLTDKYGFCNTFSLLKQWYGSVLVCISNCSATCSGQALEKCSVRRRRGLGNGVQPLPLTEASCVFLHCLHPWKEETCWCCGSRARSLKAQPVLWHLLGTKWVL